MSKDKTPKQDGLAKVRNILDSKVLTEENKNQAKNIVERLLEKDKSRHKK